jgi:hypothetical protein
MAGVIETILISLIVVVIGGVLVNIISTKYQKKIERKREEEKSRIEYKRAIKVKLNEIVETWNKELAKGRIRQIEIQNEFDMYSNQLTSIISKAPNDFPEDTIEELRDLSTSLRKIKDFLRQSGPENYELFKKECQEIIEKAEVIREKLE